MDEVEHRTEVRTHPVGCWTHPTSDDVEAESIDLVSITASRAIAVTDESQAPPFQAGRQRSFRPAVRSPSTSARAVTWRTGSHLRHGRGALPDLFFPADRSWLVSALWDDTWTCVGGPTPVIHALERDPVANARQVRPDEDALPPGLAHE
ncbi:hypothetical protein AB0K20_27860 [Micromonospora matsumotoense]|uniref:hypothetical protein n=1 Tax=Micromonospora matsumotoense TaxID=121616 RepID=UPI003427E662